MNRGQTDALPENPVRILSLEVLGDSLLEKLEHQLSRADKSVRTARGIGSTPAFGSALRAALGEVLGDRSRLIAVDQQDPLIDRTVNDLMARVPPIVHARRDRLSEDNIQVLVDTYLRCEPTQHARHAIEHDNARERARFVEEVACYTSRDLAALAGHQAGNSSATAARWKKAGKIFALPWRGSDLFPAFQFADGAPRPVIAQVLAALPDMSPWQTGFWFTSSNGWLGGSVPADRLDHEDAVVLAARREAEALAG